MCDLCIKVLDDQLLLTTNNIRKKLIADEKKLSKYMKSIIDHLLADKKTNWRNHQCETTQSECLKHLGIKSNAIKKEKKPKEPKVKKPRPAKTANKPVILPCVEEALPQLQVQPEQNQIFTDLPEPTLNVEDESEIARFLASFGC